MFALYDLNLFAEWALPDQLTFATVSALLHVASSYPEYRENATGAITQFISQTVEMLKKGDRAQLHSSDEIPTLSSDNSL